MKITLSLLAVALFASSAFAADAPQAAVSATPSASPAPAHVMNTPEECAPLEDACKKAGFYAFGGKDGMGIFAHCIKPLIEGKPAPGAKKKAPKVKPALVAKCKAAIQAKMKAFRAQHEGEKK